MPLRPDLPSSLNLGRRTTTPVKLPRMNFPMVGGVPESAAVPPNGASQATPSAGPAGPRSEAVALEEAAPARNAPTAQTAHGAGAAPACHTSGGRAAPDPAHAEPEPVRVIVYGRSGCDACLAAIQDLIDRQVSFTYYDVGRDAAAMQRLKAICGERAAVPVIIQIGFGGT